MHGWGGSCASFFGIAKYLEGNYRVTLVDLYGFGKTEHPNNPLTVDDYVLSVVRLIRHYKMQNVTLLCHSFGGRIGIKFASKYGYYLNKLILIDSAGIKPHRGIKYYFKIYKHKVLNKLKIKHDSGSDDYKKLSGTMRETFKNIVNEDLTECLSKITVPTLLIWGDKDKETPIYMAKKIHKRIRRSELIIFCGCGHFAYIQRHRLFCEIVNNFLLEDCDGVEYYGIYNRSRRNSTVKIPMFKPE